MRTFEKYWRPRYGTDMGRRMIIKTVPEVSTFKVLYRFSSIIDSCSKPNFTSNHTNPLRIKQFVCGTEVHGLNNDPSLFLHMKSVYPGFRRMNWTEFLYEMTIFKTFLMSKVSSGLVAIGGWIPKKAAQTRTETLVEFTQNFYQTEIHADNHCVYKAICRDL
jgi:hypothetical protein